MIRECLAAETTAMVEAARVVQLGNGRALTIGTLCRSLPKSVRRKIRQLHLVRLGVARMERAIRKAADL